MTLKNTWQNGEQFTATAANDVADEVNGKYAKPGSGIPITDLSSSVQVSLGKADTAIQAVAAANISDSTATGRSLITAADASAARTTLGVAYGSSAGTVVQGNDSRLSPSSASITDSTSTGRSLLTASDAAAARSAIGVAYGSTGGTVVQGDDSRVTGAEQTANKGSANGYAGLDSGGRVPAGQLPASVMQYLGTYNASTDTPSLSNGSGDTGDVYRVSVSGTRNFGAGNVVLAAGDLIIYTGSVWEKLDTTESVSSVAGRTGDVTLTVADIGGNTTTAFGVGSVELGHASDTSLTRSGAGKLAVEGVDVCLSGGAGQVADLSIVSFGANTTRAANSYGDNPFGVRLSRAITFTSVTYRAATADASGNLVCELRKNGSQVANSPKTIAAANQVTGGGDYATNNTSTGTWAFAAGDIITVYVTGVGTTPGKGLVADIKGLTT